MRGGGEEGEERDRDEKLMSSVGFKGQMIIHLT